MKHTHKGELIRLPVLELRPNEDIGGLFDRRIILRVELAAADAHLNRVFAQCDLSEHGERIFQAALQRRKAAFMALYGHEIPVQGVRYV